MKKQKYIIINLDKIEQDYRISELKKLDKREKARIKRTKKKIGYLR